MTEIALATAEESRVLYHLMAKVRALAPWTWMDETQLFGVQDPDTDEIGFVSLMGMAGEHFAVGVYRGARGLYGSGTFRKAPNSSIRRTCSIRRSFRRRLKTVTCWKRATVT